MAPTADARANRPGEVAGSAAVEPSEAGVPAAVARPSSWAGLVDNPLPALLAAVMVVLMFFNLTSTNARITDTNDRITWLENSMEARFVGQDAKLTAQMEALNAKLTAQITALDTKLTEQITALDIKLTKQITAQDAKIAALDAKIGEMNLKLTALVAALNMTDQVDAATAGTSALDAPTQGPDST